MRGLNRRLAWVARLAAVWLLALGPGGCYETHYQVFSQEDAVLVPGLEGRYVARDKDGKGARYTISRARGGKDYRYRGDDAPGGGDTLDDIFKSGVFRAVPVDENLYIMELRFRSKDRDETGSYHYAFWYGLFRVVRSDGTIVKIERLTPQPAIDRAIGRRDGVDQWGRDGPVGLSGSPAALKRFLLDMGAAEAVRTTGEVYTYTRIP